MNLYLQAADLDPSSAAPHSNPAAAYFELGNYKAAISACDSASALLGEQVKQETARQKLALRKAKSCLYSKRFPEALAVLDAIPSSDEKTGLVQSIRVYENLKCHGVDASTLHAKLIRETPRYKPSMYAVPSSAQTG